MKHRKTGRQFDRVRSQRKALMHSLMSNLLIHGRIETTEAKAKETKSAIDRVITKAKRAHSSRMEMIRKIENDISREAVDVVINKIEKFEKRDSGYARVIKLPPRKSDGAPMAIIELVDFVEKEEASAVASKKEASQEKAPAQEKSK